MRWIAVIIPAVIVLLVGYTVWPIYDLYRIASAVEARNLVALQEFVDFPSLRVSLIKQISDAYRKQSDKSGPIDGARFARKHEGASRRSVSARQSGALIRFVVNELEQARHGHGVGNHGPPEQSDPGIVKRV